MNRHDEHRRERPEEWYGERVSEWDEEQRRRRFAEQGTQDDRWRREREDRERDDRERRQRETWSSPGQGPWGSQHQGAWARDRENRPYQEGGWGGPREGGGWNREQDESRERYRQGIQGGMGSGDFGSGSGEWPYRREGQGSFGQEPSRTQDALRRASRPGSPGAYDPRFGGSQGGGYRQSFFGRGPSTYQRSDERIREDVCERLTDHPGIDATDVVVEVRDREVTLHGSVEDREQKRMAEDVAEFVSGVRDVHNKIKARQGGGFFSNLFGRGDDPRHDDREHRERDPSASMDRDRERERVTGQGSTMRGIAGSSSMGSATTAGIAGELGSNTATGETSNLYEGLEVQSSDGVRIGRVKDVRGADFVLDRPKKRALTIPRTAVSRVTTTIVTLGAAADQIDQMGWPEMQEAGGRRP